MNHLPIMILMNLLINQAVIIHTNLIINRLTTHINHQDLLILEHQISLIQVIQVIIHLPVILIMNLLVMNLMMKTL